MALFFCPECGHEVSSSAVACPNCAHPINADPPAVEPIVHKKVVATPVRRESGFPPWAFVPIGIGAILLVFFAYIMLREGSDEGNTNVNVNVAGRQRSPETVRDSRTTDVPSSSERVVVPTDPGYVPNTSTVPSSSTTVPGTSQAPVVPPDRGVVKITAKVMMPRSTGAAQPVRSAKFYLLDKDLDSILSEARVEPIEGNGFAASLGLAAVFPDRYGDFQQAAMRAIQRHIKYSGTTDSSGNASLANVNPDEYYIFGITRIGRGFAMWDAPVNIIAGENILNLSPPNVTEIPDTAG
jgi:hypothetical protein